MGKLSIQLQNNENGLAGLAKIYQYLSLVAAASLPIIAAAYLIAVVDPSLKFKAAAMHEFAIVIATVLSLFITAVAFQNYKASGEPFLRFITLGFLGFTLIYAPHGVLTRFADHHLVLFLIFGPISRLVTAIYFIVALIHAKREPDAPEQRTAVKRWLPHILLFVAVDVVIVLTASSIELTITYIRAIEFIALTIFVLSLGLALYGKRSLLMWFHVAALFLFAQASIVFLLSKPWNHLWWLAHATFATGFLVLGYALTHAYQTTRSFKRVYSVAQLHERLLLRTQALERSNDQLKIEIAERTLAETKVRNLNERLEQNAINLLAMNNELEAFSYSVSHDLRTPLRSVDAFSQILLEQHGDKLDVEGNHCLHRLRAAAQRMAQLVDDMLKLARVTRAELKIEPTNLTRLAEETIQTLRGRDPDRQAEVIVAPDLQAEGDPQLLRIVIENLFENAWKFTAKRASARIEFGAATGADGKSYFFVRDNGAGFDMAHANKLFSPFQRLHDEREFPGTGIGLATIQRIVKKHGGKVWAEGAVDQGATFYFDVCSSIRP